MISRKLQYFLKVCETGSIAKAAEALFISQQALSKAIDGLEQELGVSLFIRTSKGLSLNRFGQVLREEAWHICNHQDRLIRRMKAMVCEQERSVSVSLYSGMLLQFPPDFFESQMDAFTDTFFHFYSYPDNMHGRQFANTDVDLLFATTPFNLPELNLVYEVHIPLCVLAGAEHPLATKGRVTLDDLRREKIICINSDLEVQNRLRRDFEHCGITIHSVLSDAEQSFSYYLIRRRNTLGFYAGPESLIPEGTIRLPIEDFPGSWSFYIYERADGIPDAAAALKQKVIAYRNAHVREVTNLVTRS